MLLAERGYNVPRYAIAKKAGVSQAVLYRHFPNKVDLALEVFADNYAQIDHIVSHYGEDAIFVLWDWLLERAVVDIGFIETIRAAHMEGAHYEGVERLREALRQALEQARQAGHDLGELTARELVKAWRMAYGLAITSLPHEITLVDLKRDLSLTAVQALFAKEPPAQNPPGTSTPSG